MLIFNETFVLYNLLPRLKDHYGRVGRKIIIGRKIIPEYDMAIAYINSQLL